MAFWKMIVVHDWWQCSSFVLLLQGGSFGGVGVTCGNKWIWVALGKSAAKKLQCFCYFCVRLDLSADAKL
jgi:hypothetical protein